MSTVIVSPAMRRAADRLLERADFWARGVRTSDGLAFVTFTSARQPGRLYFTSQLGCTCPGYRHRGRCCHELAVREHQQRQQPAPAASTPTPRLRLDDVFPPCRSCGDLADGRDGFCDRCASDREWAARHAV